MDSSLDKPLIFKLLFIPLAIFSSFFFSSSSSSSGDLIDNVCSDTRNPCFCSTSLRSDPLSGTGDLKILGQISIKLSSENLNKTLKVLLPKLRNSNRTLVGIYDTCLENYGDGVDSLNDCSSDLNKSDFEGMIGAASAAETDVDTCDDSFRELGDDVNEPQELVNASKIAFDLISVVLAIASRLRNG